MGFCSSTNSKNNKTNNNNSIKAEKDVNLSQENGSNGKTRFENK